MADDILSQYGSDSNIKQSPRATNGGQLTAKDLSYSTPVGPKGQMHQGPGLGDKNYGNCVMQGKH